MPSTADSVRYEFGRLAAQYYVEGRFAARYVGLPTCGNLLHHAIEMALKACLAQTVDLATIKTYSHSLPKLHTAACPLAPTLDTTVFAETIARLHEFESIRYPDRLLTEGGGMIAALFPPAPGDTWGPLHGPPARQYVLIIQDVDRLFCEAFRRANLNPAAFFGSLRDEARRYLCEHNPESAFLSICPPTA